MCIALMHKLSYNSPMKEKTPTDWEVYDPAHMQEDNFTNVLNIYGEAVNDREILDEENRDWIEDWHGGMPKDSYN